MSWSVEQTLCVFVISLLFFQAKSQVISDTKAKVGTLKHLVHLEVFLECVNEDNEKMTGYYSASGSLIKLNWILTAAHNVEDNNVTTDNGFIRRYFVYKVEVVAGTKDWKKLSNETTQQRTVYKKNISVHKKYDPASKYYDVALIYTKKKFEITDTVEPAKLLEPGMEFDRDAKCVIQGWGYNKIVFNKKNQLKYSRPLPNHAMQGIVNILNGVSCTRVYVNFNSNIHFCYGCNDGKCEQTAPGDSGTPVVCALEKGDNPLYNGVVFAVHNSGCEDIGEKCYPDGPSRGTDVRKIRKWIKLSTNERGRKRTGIKKPSDRRMYPYFIAGAVVVGTVLKYLF